MLGSALCPPAFFSGTLPSPRPHLVVLQPGSLSENGAWPEGSTGLRGCSQGSVPGSGCCQGTPAGLAAERGCAQAAFLGHVSGTSECPGLCPRSHERLQEEHLAGKSGSGSLGEERLGLQETRMEAQASSAAEESSQLHGDLECCFPRKWNKPYRGTQKHGPPRLWGHRLLGLREHPHIYLCRHRAARLVRVQHPPRVKHSVTGAASTEGRVDPDTPHGP